MSWKLKCNEVKSVSIAAILTLGSAGCVTTHHTPIESNRDYRYAKQISRVYVVDRIGAVNEKFTFILNNELREAFTKIGVVAVVHTATNLELDEKELLEKARKEKADAMLHIGFVKQTSSISQYGSYVQRLSIDLGMYDLPTSKRIWRAKADVRFGNEYENGVRNLAKDIVTKLHEDRLIVQQQ